MNLNSHIHKKGISMKSLRLFMILTLVVLLSACNTATQVTKVQKWRNDFKIGSLQGYYDVQTLKAEKEMKSLMKQLLKKVRFYYKLQKMIRLFMKKKSLLKRRFAFEASKSGSYDLIVRVKGEKRKQKKFKYILSYEKR